MPQTKKYKATTADAERKLERVMARLGVEHYDYDWSQTKAGGSCYVEMRYGGRTYRFENDTAKSAASGKNLRYVSDLFAAVVYSLEGLARAVEQDIFTLDMLLTGVPALPEGKPLEPCFTAMGFSKRPETEDELKEQYRRLAKVLHPDHGGDPAAFNTMTQNYSQCLDLLKQEKEDTHNV